MRVFFLEKFQIIFRARVYINDIVGSSVVVIKEYLRNLRDDNPKSK